MALNYPEYISQFLEAVFGKGCARGVGTCSKYCGDKAPEREDRMDGKLLRCSAGVKKKLVYSVSWYVLCLPFTHLHIITYHYVWLPAQTDIEHLSHSIGLNSKVLHAMCGPIIPNKNKSHALIQSGIN